MKKMSIVFMVVLAAVVFLIPRTPQAATPSASTAKKTPELASAAAQPQPGGIYKVLIRSRNNAFGYPPQITGSGRDYAPPFFDRLFSVGEDGKYKPGLALSWDTSKDGKTMTFKLRKGVTFHDGTPFNAQAVKANFDDLIPPKATILPGVISVDVVDDYTVRLNLSEYSNIINYHITANPATWIYSPEALKKNGADWATTHPVGTGPFMLKDFVPNTSLTLVKNPHYWQKGLPYLDGIEISMVPDIMTMVLTLKAGQANAIYDPQGAAAQLDANYPLQKVPSGGSFMGFNFDTKNSEIFSKLKVRTAMEYAIDKEAICDGPGLGGLLNFPVYQLHGAHSPDYNKACPPRKYDPVKAKKLLAEAGYPNGFSFKFFAVDTTWKDGWVAVQSFLDKVGIKMDINYVNISQFNLIKSGKIEKGAAALQNYPNPSCTLFMLETYYSSNSIAFPYIVKPEGIDKLINQGKSSRNPAAVTKINQKILKLLYDDETVIPLFQQPRMAALDKSVQNTGWFINGDSDNNEFGHRTWLKK